MRSELLQKLFSSVFQVCNLETDTQKTFCDKKQKITPIALLYFAFVIAAHTRVALAHTPRSKLALSTALAGTQLPVCLSAFLNKYTAIRPMQRPLTEVICTYCTQINNTGASKRAMTTRCLARNFSLWQVIHIQNTMATPTCSTAKYVGIHWSVIRFGHIPEFCSLPGSPLVTIGKSF